MTAPSAASAPPAPIGFVGLGNMGAALTANLVAAGIGYVDAPVSGGVAGARARTLTVMYAGPPAACAAVEPVLAGLSDRRFHVGDRAGMGQALKLANNFLSAAALVATSEAVAFGTSVGPDMATMLEVLGASSGRSAAISDKFVNHVLPGTYASGFANTLMAKDLGLYRPPPRPRARRPPWAASPGRSGSASPTPGRAPTSPASTPSRPAPTTPPAEARGPALGEGDGPGGGWGI